MKFGSQVDLQKVPVKGIIPEATSTAPSAPGNGQLWTDSSVSPPVIRYWNGSVWVNFIDRAAQTGTQSADTITDGTTNKVYTATEQSKLAGIASGATANSTDAQLRDRATHTGTQTASTISNFDTQVRTSRLDQMAIPTAGLNFNSQVVSNLGAPVNATDAARLADVQNAQAGIDVKPSVRAATTANITLSGTQTVDGVALAVGDRVLVKNQSTATQNGLYVVASGAWSRTSDTLTPNTFVFTEEGTSQADTAWMITNDGTITPGTTNITWTQFAGATAYTGGTGITVAGTVISLQTPVTVANGGTGATTAAGAKTNFGFMTRYNATLGSLTAGQTTTITHNLGSQFVQAMFFDASTNEEVGFTWAANAANTITITPDLGYAASAIRVVVIG